MFTPAVSIKTDLIPDVKGSVRAELIIGGWVLEKIDEKKTNVVYISCVK